MLSKNSSWNYFRPLFQRRPVDPSTFTSRVVYSGKSRRVQRGGKSLALCVAGLLATSLGTQASADHFWTLEKPSSVGLSDENVRGAVDHVFNSQDAAVRDCFLVVKDGKLIAEHYSSEFYRDFSHEGNSITKSLGALLVGWAVTNNFLDMDADITKTYNVPSPRPYPVTTRQVLAQSVAGVHEANEAWAYDAGGTMWLHVLPDVFYQATGRRPSSVWNEHFAQILGLSEEFSWPSVDINWATGSEGTCRDYAKIGQLLLDRGTWRPSSIRIISSSFIDEMTRPQSRLAHPVDWASNIRGRSASASANAYLNPCYGLLTWLNTNPGSDRGSDKYPGTCQMWDERCWLPSNTPSDLFILSGVLGQDTIVIPSLNIVLVSLGTTADDYPVQRVLGEALCMLDPAGCSQNIAV